MNKKELAESIGVSVVTISRYISMGMPADKVGGKYNFDLAEVESWINDYIDRRPPEQYDRPPSPEEATRWGFNMLRKYVKFMEKRLCDRCHEKFMSDIESGKF